MQWGGLHSDHRQMMVAEMPVAKLRSKVEAPVLCKGAKRCLLNVVGEWGAWIVPRPRDTPL